MITIEKIKNSLKEFKPTSHKINLSDSNLGDISNRFFKLNTKDGIKFKLFVFSDRINIVTPVNVSLLFAVNLPDNVCLANKILANDTENKVYTDLSMDNEILTCIDLLKEDLIKLKLEQNEGLFVYQNNINLVVKNTRQLIPEIQILERIKSIIELKFPNKPQTIDSSKIPEAFQDLIPILFEWAISDDLERSEKIKKSSKAKLKKLTDIVYPKMDGINNYLNSFDNEPLPHEATLIGNLAELICEITLNQSS